MSTYLSRPIFPFVDKVDWTKTPNASFTIDLAKIALTQGPAKHQPVMTTVVSGFDIQIELENETDIIALETFIDACAGRLNSFWLPGHETEFTIAAGNDATSFYIHATGYESGDYLALLDSSDVWHYAKVTAVAKEGTRELVTIDASLTVDATWYAARLLYCRLATDDVDLEGIANNWATCQLRIVELPNEYAAIETGQQPIYLYDFWFEGDTSMGGNPRYWRFTSFNSPSYGLLTSGGLIYTPWQITHTDRVQSTKGGDDKLTLKTVYENADGMTLTPIAKLFPFASKAVLWVRVWETTWTTLATRTQIFGGIIDSMELDGNDATLEARSIVSVLGRTFPPFQICNQCNYPVFGTLCGVAEATYKKTAQVLQVGGRSLIVKHAGADEAAKHWTWGKLKWQSASTGDVEWRTIETAEYGAGHLLAIQLTERILDAAELDVVTIWPGCDGQRLTCVNKFDNFVRWGGHNYARQNIAIQAIEADQTNGNKK